MSNDEQRPLVRGLLGVSLATILAGALLILAQPVGAAAPPALSLSRWQLTLVAVADHEIDFADAGVMDSFCRDADGCVATLRLEGAGSAMAVDSTRLFLSESSVLRWATPLGAFFDDTAPGDEVIHLNSGSHHCIFGDADHAGGDDIDPGFSLHVVSTTTVTCVLVLID